MKKPLILTILISFLCIHYSFGQGVNIIGHLPKDNRLYYVGSLNTSSGYVFQKLKVEVFGGYYASASLSTETYTISTRDQNRINWERRGGASTSHTLKVFKTDVGYDFAIEIGDSYTSILVQSWLVDGPLNQISPTKLVNIVKYEPGNKPEVRHEFTETLLTFTDEYGNLGIGTNKPKAKLDVKGAIRAKEVKIEINAGEGADFVFEPDYRLTPLSEVELFINENKHLPEIPSEKQMQEEDLSLSKMQIKLLQKVEELTLYAIQQQKLLDEQIIKNRQLEEKVETLQKAILKD